jgi:hypothetical protein
MEKNKFAKSVDACCVPEAMFTSSCRCITSGGAAAIEAITWLNLQPSTVIIHIPSVFLMGRGSQMDKLNGDKTEKP